MPDGWVISIPDSWSTTMTCLQAEDGQWGLGPSGYLKCLMIDTTHYLLQSLGKT